MQKKESEVVHNFFNQEGEIKATSAPYEKDPLSDPQPVPQVSALADELQAYFNAAPNDLKKEALLQNIQGIIQKYPLFPPTYYSSINNLIIFLAEQNCSLHISSDEVVCVWST